MKSNNVDFSGGLEKQTVVLAGDKEITKMVEKVVASLTKLIF